MEERYSTKKLLVLRKLTRAVADLLRGQVKEYLATLGPLLRQRSVLGDFIESNTKEPVKGSEAAFKELQHLYETVAPAKPFGLPKELKPPLEVISALVEITPTEYAHEAKTEKESKTVTVTSPLQWVVSYAGFGPRRAPELLADRNRMAELQQFVLHALMLQIVLIRQPGLVKLLGALSFPVSTGRLPGCGDLPITYLSAAVTTLRPPDDVIIESTEVSGMDAFEEVVSIDEIVQLRDPLRDRLIEIVKAHGEDLLPK
jgi:hypothetical protein